MVCFDDELLADWMDAFVLVDHLFEVLDGGGFVDLGGHE